MKAGILLNRDRARLRSTAKVALHAASQVLHGHIARVGKVLLPDYDSFAKVLSPSPVYLGTGDAIPWRALKECDLLIWEWGWTDTPAKTVLEIQRRLSIPLMMFTGPPERWWRELDSRDLGVQFEAARATQFVGVMLRDMVPYYEALLPGATVFHMPDPVEAEYFGEFAARPEKRNRDRVYLTCPTQFTGHGSRLPIATYLVFRKLLQVRRKLEGFCIAYTEEERLGAQEVFRELGISTHVEIRPYTRNLFRYFEAVSPCYMSLFLPYALVLGRVALMNACLGIPMVTSDEIETHRFLYPRTTVKWYDTDAAFELCLRLLEDDVFYGRVKEQARERVEYYSVERCRERMLTALGKTSPKE